MTCLHPRMTDDHGRLSLLEVGDSKDLYGKLTVVVRCPWFPGWPKPMKLIETKPKPPKVSKKDVKNGVNPGAGK